MEEKTDAFAMVTSLNVVPEINIWRLAHEQKGGVGGATFVY